jgi:hypothetical protein
MLLQRQRPTKLLWTKRHLMAGPSSGRCQPPPVSLSSTSTTGSSALAAAAAAGGFACDRSSSPEKLTTYANKYITIDTSSVYLQYLIKRYKYAKSYNAGGFYWDQFLICEVGGAQPANRLLNVGAASTDRVSASKISGWKWTSGCGKGALSATLTIGVDYIVVITGSVTQTLGKDCNQGAQGRAPIGISPNDYPQNEVAAWWATGCSGWPWCGSTEYQASNPLGRWDFHNGGLSNQHFNWAVYATVYDD